MKALLPTLFVLLLSTNLQADIEITIRDDAGGISTISSNGKSARMNDSRDPNYMLIDFKTNSMRSVDTQRREIMDLSGMKNMRPVTNAPTASPLNVKLVDQGSGPKIANYGTRKFSIQANGKNCGTIFGSKKVFGLKGVSEIFAVFSDLQRQSRRMAGGFRAMLDECTQADLQMADHYQASGAPLRVLDRHGKLESEVIRIDTRARKPAGYYDAPTGYRVTDVQQQMQQAQQQQRQMMQQMPDMNQIMQQMQQQPGMPPDALEQMKKMQQMFKQGFPQQ